MDVQKRKKVRFAPDRVQLRRLLRPTSIAIIGATDTGGKTGAMITHNLVRGGFSGRTVCINPHRETVYGQPCYASLADAPEPQVDCAVVVVPAHLVEDVVRASMEYCSNFVVIAAGFGESGEEGRAREASLLRLANENKLAILGPNCLGFITPGIKANASFAPHVFADGSVALLSQSGALAVALLDQAALTTQGFSFVISLGNKMQIDESLLMSFLAQDDATEVMALYIEDIANGEHFIAQAREMMDKKPIIVLRGGATEAGQKASASHTGALMQESAVFDAVCRKYGVVQTTTFSQFVDVIAFMRRYGASPVCDSVVVTNAGGLGVLAIDSFDRAHLPVHRIAQSVQTSLAKKLPRAASAVNPIDVLGDADTARYQSVFDTLAREKACDTIFSILTPQAQTPVMDIARLIVQECEKRNDIKYITAFVGGARVEDARRFLLRNNVPTVPTPERVVAVLGALYEAHAYRYSDAPATAYNEKRHARGAQIYARVVDEERPSLYYSEIEKICTLYDVPLVHAWRMNYDSPSSVTFPCVVKVDAPTVLHKTDQGGVIVGIEDGIKLNDAIETLQRRFPGERVIVQPMVEHGIELIIGAKRDATFGPIVLIGYGGIYAEEIAMTELFVPSFSVEDIRMRLEASRFGFLFRTTRGQQPYDSAAVAHIVTAVGQIMIENEWIQEIDINPLFVYNDGKDACVVDMKIIIQK